MIKSFAGDAVVSVATVEAVSKKTGNPYTQIKVKFANGYEFSGFLTPEQKMLIEQNKHTEVK